MVTLSVIVRSSRTTCFLQSLHYILSVQVKYYVSSTGVCVCVFNINMYI